MLDRLTLPSEILAAIDVPAEQAPKGLTHMELRKIARLGEREAHMAAFARWLPGRAAKK